MNKLIIVRHGESTGNANHIIQGKNNNYRLTNNGRKEICSKTKENIEKLKNANRIIVSPYERTIETARIISQETGLPIHINEQLKEMDSGILSGVNKEIAKKQFPEYYRIWKNREDLDAIPNAESGERLQARAIGFLMQYYNQQEFCDVIVTHAGFIRCLINTIEGRKRTYAFPINNGEIFEIEDILKKIGIEKKDRAMSSEVFIINTADGKYVAKLKHGQISNQDNAEKELLDKLNIQNKPNILSMQNYENNMYCKIIKYVNGEHRYGELSNDEYQALIDSEEKLKILLSREKNEDFKRNNLKENIERIYSETKNRYIKGLAKKLLDSKYISIIEDVDNYVLSHNDLNRDNILFEKNEKGQVKANIIDFESLEYAPTDFQFASMLASGLLIEGENIKKIEKTIYEKGKNLEKILYFMQIRVLKGLHFFTNKDIYILNNTQASTDLLKRYFFSSAKIQLELNRIMIEREKSNEKIFYR